MEQEKKAEAYGGFEKNTAGPTEGKFYYSLFCNTLLTTRFSFVHTEEGEEESFATNWDLEVNKFDDMGLREEVLRGIYGYGYKDPSPIQMKGILPLIQGKDTIAQVSINDNLTIIAA